MNASDARKAHKILDDLLEGNMVLDEEREFLRSALPEYPRQMTLKEIHVMVNDYYTNESDVYGYLPIGGKHVRPWLNELRVQLYGLVREQGDARESSPSLPEGMRIADHKNFGRVVVSPGVGIDRCHEIFYLDPGMSSGTDISEVEPDSLTFIDEGPAHPEFLETEADYRDAPMGTVVAQDNMFTAWVKLIDGWASTDGDMSKSCPSTSCTRRVLRWGWGEQA